MDIIETNITKDLAEINVIAQSINNLECEAKALKLEHAQDKKNYQLIKSFRFQNIVKLRTQVEKKRKETKAIYLEAAKKIDDAAKGINERILQVEKICDEQILIFDTEQKRLAEEAQAKRNAQIQTWVNKLKESGITQINVAFIQSCNEEQFNAYYDVELAKHQAVLKREAELKAEAEKIRLQAEKQQKELEEMRAKAAQAEATAKAAQQEQEAKDREIQELRDKNKALEEENAKQLIKIVDEVVMPIGLTEQIIDAFVPVNSEKKILKLEAHGAPEQVVAITETLETIRVDIVMQQTLEISRLENIGAYLFSEEFQTILKDRIAKGEYDYDIA
jgi:hypothetical protein